MSEMFGCKAFRQFLEAEGLLYVRLRKGTGLSQRNSCLFIS